MKSFTNLHSELDRAAIPKLLPEYFILSVSATYKKRLLLTYDHKHYKYDLHSSVSFIICSKKSPGVIVWKFLALFRIYYKYIPLLATLYFPPKSHQAVDSSQY